MNKKATPVDVAEAALAVVNNGDEIRAALNADQQQAASAAHKQTRDLATALLRIALDLSTMGHAKASREVQSAALKLARVKPGQHA